MCSSAAEYIKKNTLVPYETINITIFFFYSFADNPVCIMWVVSNIYNHNDEVSSWFCIRLFCVLALEWLPWQDASHDLIVALHPPYSVILWNADTGTKLWKKSYTEAITSIALDPFCFRNMACKFVNVKYRYVDKYFYHSMKMCIMQWLFIPLQTKYI